MGKKFEAFLTRHSTKGKDSPYEQLSPEGVEKAEKRVQEIAELIESAEKGSVIFMGGNSSEERTRSTLQVYVDGLKSKFAGKEEYLFFDREKIKEEASRGYRNAARTLQEEADLHPEAKVIVDLQLQLNELGMERLMDDSGEVKQGWAALLEKHGKDYTAAIKEWISSDTTGVNPTEIAEDYLHALRRLEHFVKRFSGNRETKFVLVGHSFVIDALLTYLANDGQINLEGFDKIGGTVVEETELSRIESDGEGNTNLHYRGQDYTFRQTKGDNLVQDNIDEIK